MADPGQNQPARWPVGTGRPKILVVDDDSTTRQMVAAMLASLGDVLTAVDGAAALQIVLDEVPAVIVTDVAMPNVDGLSLARRLKADRRTAHVPLVMLTGRDRPSDVIAGVNAGARYYVQKPVDAAELSMRVKKALG